MPKVIKSNFIKEETIRLLKKFQILKDLTSDEVRLLLGTKEGDYQKRIAKLVQYDLDETIIRENDFDSWIFWIVAGAFAVTKNNVIIAEFDKPGEVFGEMSCLDIDKRSASVIATMPSACVSIDMSILDTFENETIKNKIKDGIQRLQAKRLSKTTARLVEEREIIIEQQKNINKKVESLFDLENKLNLWEKELQLREKKLKSVHK